MQWVYAISFFLHLFSKFYDFFAEKKNKLCPKDSADLFLIYLNNKIIIIFFKYIFSLFLLYFFHTLSIFTKSLFCLKPLCEAMERLLFEEFIVQKNQKMDQNSLLLLIQCCNKNHLSKGIVDPSTMQTLSGKTDESVSQ